MTQNMSKSPTDEPPLEIWLSGNENINLVTDLLDPQPKATQRCGRSKRLALEYASAALKYPNQKIRIKDHHKNNDAHYKVQRYVTQILDVLGIEYEIGRLANYKRDESSFTGTVRSSEDGFYITARPTMPPDT